MSLWPTEQERLSACSQRFTSKWAARGWEVFTSHSERQTSVKVLSTSPQVHKHPSPWTPNWYEDWASAYSSDNKSCKSLFRSRKQPNECMLSNTSGSISSKEGRERICTFRGIGCSGSGSFLPPLQRKEDEGEKGGGKGEKRNMSHKWTHTLKHSLQQQMEIAC